MWFFFTLHLFGKCKHNLVLVSPTKFFHDYSQGVCQARCVAGLLKSMTLFLIFGQHPKISCTGIFGMTLWHLYASICFLQRTVILLQIKNPLCFHQCTCTTNCKHQWYGQREMTSETTERFTILYCLSEHLLATWEQGCCHAVLKTWSFSSAWLSYSYGPCLHEQVSLTGMTEEFLFTESGHDTRWEKPQTYWSTGFEFEMILTSWRNGLKKMDLSSAGTSARHHRYVVVPIRHRKNSLGSKCRRKAKKGKWELVDCKLNTSGNVI